MTDAYVGRHQERRRITALGCAAALDIAASGRMIVEYDPNVIRSLFVHSIVKRTYSKHRTLVLTRRGKRLVERITAGAVG